MKQNKFLSLPFHLNWRVLVIGMGLLLALAPSLWSAVSYHQAAQDIQSIHQQSKQADTSALDALFAQGHAWNARLAGQPISDGQPASDQLLEYDQQLNVLEGGIMGILTIPCIDVSLPIYHGCSEEALSSGAGHLPSSSLPIGSPTGRVVLSAHRGLMSAALFTRLDEVRQGDLFLIENPKEKLAYQVSSIEVIMPEDIEALAIVPDQDLVTLMTCTPYGINSHRLLVTGQRIDWQEEKIEATIASQKPAPSLREQLFRLWPWFLMGLVVIVFGIRFWSKHHQASRKA